MQWQRTGTVTVTNGSATVTGASTLWSDVGTLNPGDIFNGPDGKLYEILTINSNTGITLNSVYLGSSLSGQAYSIMPIGLLPSTLAQQVKTTLATANTAMASTVRYDINSMGLTLTQQQNARTNIAALSALDVGQGTLNKSIAGGVDVTLTAAEASNQYLSFTGALTANINVIVPVATRLFMVGNSTSGAFTLTIKTASIAGVKVAQGAQSILGCNMGGNVFDAITGVGSGLGVTGALNVSGTISGRQSNGQVFASTNGTDSDFSIFLASTDAQIVNTSATGKISTIINGVVRSQVSTTGLAAVGVANYNDLTTGYTLTLSNTVGTGSSSTPINVAAISFGTQAANSFFGKIAVVQPNSSGSTASYMAFFVNSGGGNPGVFEAGRFDNIGNLLIGTSASTMAGLVGMRLNSAATTGIVYAKADVNKGYTYFDNGTSAMHLDSVAGTTIQVVSGSAGVSLANAATSWGAISDETLKDIIEPITGAAEKVFSLRTVIGKYKTDDEAMRRSFLIAQDVQKVLPEAIAVGADGILSLQYTDTIPLIVASQNETYGMVQNHESRIAALEAATLH